MARKINLVLIDDEPTVCEGYAFMFSIMLNYRVVGKFHNCEKAYEHLPRLDADIILLDLQLGEVTSLGAIPKLKTAAPSAEIAILSALTDQESVLEAFRAGAVGYFSKSASPQALSSGLEDIMEGGTYMSPEVAHLVVKSFHRNLNSPLTERETEVLEQLALGKTAPIIANALGVSKETIRSHIKNIYLKLQVNTKADAIAVARKSKLI